MPPDMSISMRHTKLKAEEAALIAGELTKPTWESRNEGIHERISFEDTLWGFDLAGGVYYKTPLRVTFVKPDSRAEKAGIKPGDKLLRINGIDTSTLTIQEAHQMIVESGIHIKLAVTSPDDFDDAYYYYEDPILDGYDSEEERRLEEEKAKKRRVRAKVSSYWSLQWPWVSRKRLIYRESNCFMVTSKYEEKHRDKYPIRPVQRYFDDIILYNDEDEKEIKSRQPSKSGPKQNSTNEAEEVTNGEDTESETEESNVPTIAEQDDDSQEGVSTDDNVQIEDITEPSNDNKQNETVVPESKTDSIHLEDDTQIDATADNVEDSENNIEESSSRIKENELSSINEVDNETEKNELNVEMNDDEVLDEVLGKTDNTPKSEEDNILDSILSDEGQNLENSESMNER